MTLSARSTACSVMQNGYFVTLLSTVVLNLVTSSWVVAT
jgi:hypothetical protein